MDERIEDYFEKKLNEQERQQFEASLSADPELAQSFAFHIAAKEAARLEARKLELQTRHAEWQKVRPLRTRYTSFQRWYAVAAAIALLGFSLAWYFLIPQEKPLATLADGYALEHFTTLSVQMGGSEDSLQMAKASYNKGQYATALKICESLLKANSAHGGANELAGIISLKLLDYDKAITYFHQLSEQKNLYSNPGKFYEAIALIKSGEPLNKKKAELLLNEVITNNLEGKAEAEKWLQ